ncbi:MAG: insulinase family protein [bacterium]|nr:insulinase family protein [bacterium]
MTQPQRPTLSSAKTGTKPRKLHWEAGDTLKALQNRVERYRLRNGLTVLLIPDHTTPIVTTQFWVKTGSRNERPGITGISHLFEHMMFRGSLKYGPEEHANIVKRNGGLLNAYTFYDHTVYFETMTSDKLELAIHLEAERFANLRIDPKVLSDEKKVVAEERLRRYDNSLGGSTTEQILINSFRSSPYSWPVIGWMHDIKNYSLDDVQEYYRLRYAPNNVVAVISGDFTSAQALKLLRKYWGKIPAQPTPPQPYMQEITQRGERRITHKFPSELPSVSITFKIPPLTHSDLPAVLILSDILGKGESSRLYQRLVYRDRTARNAYASCLSLVGQGLMFVEAGLQPGIELPQAEAAIWEEIERIQREGVSEPELEKARNYYAASSLRQLTTTSGLGTLLGLYENDTGDYRNAFKKFEQLERVTLADIQRCAKSYLDHDQSVIVQVFPNHSAEKGANQ